MEGFSDDVRSGRKTIRRDSGRFQRSGVRAAVTTPRRLAVSLGELHGCLQTAGMLNAWYEEIADEIFVATFKASDISIELEINSRDRDAEERPHGRLA